MAKPKNAIPSVEKTICLPADLVGKVELHLLFSQVEARVPFGAWARYVTGLIREDLAKRGL